MNSTETLPRLQKGRISLAPFWKVLFLSISVFFFLLNENVKKLEEIYSLVKAGDQKKIVTRG